MRFDIGRIDLAIGEVRHGPRTNKCIVRRESTFKSKRPRKDPRPIRISEKRGRSDPFPLNLSFVDRHVFLVAFANVFGTRADQFVVAVLFEDVAGPAGDAADGEDRRVHVEGMPIR